MKTPSDYESDLGLPAGTIHSKSNTSGDHLYDSDGIEIPLSCSLWSLRCICTRRGLDAQIETGMLELAANPQGIARAIWAFQSNKFQRSDWFIKNLRTWIGYTNKQMDNLFSAAIDLENNKE